MAVIFALLAALATFTPFALVAARRYGRPRDLPRYLQYESPLDLLLDLDERWPR